MKKAFNTTGVCVSGRHYMLPPQDRCPDAMDLIRGESYFIIHAARQSGKTTLLKSLVESINAEGSSFALYCSLEACQGIPEPENGIPQVVRCLIDALRVLPEGRQVTFVPDWDGYTVVLKATLSSLCQQLTKPLVLLFDEVDCMTEGTLILFLRQLRDGFNCRATTPFPASVALVGMRNVRDYKAKVRPDGDTLGSASPFNISARSLTLKNFSREEIAALYAQHTEATGQVFPPVVVDRVFEQTQGQPWLVNAIAKEMVEEILERDYSKAIAEGQVEQAIQNIVFRRDTHIDSLLERLKEPRVRNIIEPILTGSAGMLDFVSDDFLYVKDLGLIRQGAERLEPSNPIYREVIVRWLNYDAQETLKYSYPDKNLPRYLNADQTVNMRFLLEEFQQFWRENSEAWVERFDYKEAAPHLILMAFLQRVVNGGGSITREYAAATGRIDLLLEHNARKYPMELKLWESPRAMKEGLEQMTRYLDKLGEREGWLILFDRRPGKTWEEKISWKTEILSEKTIHVVGC